MVRVAQPTVSGVPREGVPASVVDYATPVGPAVLAVDVPAHPLGVLVLGHGAGGDIEAADLLAVREGALGLGLAVVRVRQPYRVAGRRAPAPAAQLDRAFLAVLDGIRSAGVAGLRSGLPLVVGGRSSGARVAARNAYGTSGLLVLAFPLTPPGKQVSRLDELLDARVPTLALQGSRDAFGSAQRLRCAVEGTDIVVVEVLGVDHGFRARTIDPVTTDEALTRVRDVAAAWLERLLPVAPQAERGSGNRRAGDAR